MGRGNPDNLRAAARRKSENATRRADQAIRQLIKDGQPITFRGVAHAAGCSIDVLYSSNDLRPRIEHLRAQQQGTPPAARQVESQPPSESSIVRTLTAQLNELKQRHHRETQELKAALAAAQGEILALKRQHPQPPH
jgi:Family of unknown function (DUF6262)